MFFDFDTWRQCRNYAVHNYRINGRKTFIYKSNGRWIITTDTSKPAYVPPPEPVRTERGHVNKFPWFQEGDFAVIDFYDGESTIARRTLSYVPAWYVMGNEQEIEDTEIETATSATIVVKGLKWSE